MSEADDAPGHLDEAGGPCARHEAPKLDVVLSLALVGSRAQGFNHDLASKLQGLLMALEELDELIAKRGDEDMRRAAADASSATQDLADLLAANRELSRASPRTNQPLRELLQRAGDRSGVVLVGELADVEISAVTSVATQALALALDVAAGPGRGGRLPATCRRLDRHLELEVAVVEPSPPNAAEYLALASEMLRRDGGDLRCGAGRLVLRLALR